MILVLTQERDRHGDYMSTILRRRGYDFVRFNPAHFPTQCSIAIEYLPKSAARKTLAFSSETLDLENITGVWYRRPLAPVSHAIFTESSTSRYIEKECEVVLQDLWSTLTCTWLPGQPVQCRRAEHKGLQLQTALEVGLEVPPTLITSSPDALLDFYRQHGGNIITKLASSALHLVLGPHWVRYTEPVTTRDIVKYRDIQLCPIIAQSYVPKQMELRITVVGQRVFAAEIHSQANNHTKHDWRHYDLSRTPHFPHQLPADVVARCVKLTERLHLCYGAIDMILTPDGRYVFIEINPNGQYLWIEEQTGLPISEAICDLLAGNVHNDSPEAPYQQVGAFLT